MIPTPQPKRAIPLTWEGRHLYRVWADGRRLYQGSVVRGAGRRWEAWRRHGNYLGTFEGQAAAAEALEEHIREREEEAVCPGENNR